MLTGVGNRTMFFALWWKGLDDASAAALLPEDHADHRHFLLDLRRDKPYNLDEAREQLINLKDGDGIDALLTLYSILTNRLKFELTVDGERRTLTRDQLMSHAFAADPELRAAVYRELYRVYAREATPLGQVYIHRVRDWHNEGVTLRGHASAIAVRNRANDIPDPAVETLLDVVREHAPPFQRYFRLKAGWLGCRAPPAALRHLRADRHLQAARFPTPRACARCSTPLPASTRGSPACRARLRRAAHRRRAAQGQEGRRLLRHRPAAPHALGARQLHRPRA